MPFTDVKLSDVELEKPASIPIGTYKFKLQPGAQTRVNKFNGVEELNVRFDVAEGEYAGRPVFVNYPDPTAIQQKGKNAGKPMAFSAQALKRLEIALGEDSLPGEDPQTYLNRVATSGNSFITAQMVDASYVKNGATVPKFEFGIFTVGAAA
jgi:hypothetical protein